MKRRTFLVTPIAAAIACVLPGAPQAETFFVSSSGPSLATILQAKAVLDDADVPPAIRKAEPLQGRLLRWEGVTWRR